jgi:hypothetical protein
MTKIDLSQEHSTRLFSVSWLGAGQGLTQILGQVVQYVTSGQVGSQGELVRHFSSNFRINNWLIVFCIDNVPIENIHLLDISIGIIFYLMF